MRERHGVSHWYIGQTGRSFSVAVNGCKINVHPARHAAESGTSAPEWHHSMHLGDLTKPDKGRSSF